MSITLDEFIKKWTGKHCDWDGKWPDQCVDLYRFYVKEVLDFPQSPPVAGACNIWDTYLTNCFERIDNTPEGIPQKGDIIIWNANTGGGFGHVAIFVEGNVNSFKSFDCNWPTGSLPHIQGHYYKNVLGWLKPKGENMPNFYKGIDLSNEESVKVCVDTWKDVVDKKYITKKTFDEFNVDYENFKEQSIAFKEFIEKLAQKLSCEPKEAIILGEVGGLITKEDQKTEQDKEENKEQAEKDEEIKKIEVKQSRICAWLAKHGL